MALVADHRYAVSSGRGSPFHSLGVMNHHPQIFGVVENATTYTSVAAPTTPPHTYLAIAQFMLHGVAPLAAAGANASVALAFVAAQVVECSLKAYLSRNGDDKRLKAKSVRHNLEALWHLAHAEGLALSAPIPSWLTTLNELHDDPFRIRYSTGAHGLFTPASEPMATDIAALVSLVARHIQQPSVNSDDA